MRVLPLAFLLTPFCSAMAGWHIEPSTCITEVAQQRCQMSLRVQNLDFENQLVCVWLGNEKLGCETLQHGELQWDIALDDETLLAITQGDVLLYQHTLHVSSVQAKKPRRRIRLPWSLF